MKYNYNDKKLNFKNSVGDIYSLKNVLTYIGVLTGYIMNQLFYFISFIKFISFGSSIYYSELLFSVMVLYYDIMKLVIFIGSFIFIFLYYLLKNINNLLYLKILKNKKNLNFQKINKNINILNTILELLWTTTPGILLIYIAIPSISILYLLRVLKINKVSFITTGYQWYWGYEFHNFTQEWGIIRDQSHEFDSNLVDSNVNRLLTVNNKLILPYNHQIRNLITSNDVLHSWALPTLGYKMDACPGRLNEISFESNLLGTVFGQCSEICGINHAFMPIVVRFLKMRNFMCWATLKGLDFHHNRYYDYTFDKGFNVKTLKKDFYKNYLLFDLSEKIQKPSIDMRKEAIGDWLDTVLDPDNYYNQYHWYLKYKKNHNVEISFKEYLNLGHLKAHPRFPKKLVTNLTVKVKIGVGSACGLYTVNKVCKTYLEGQRMRNKVLRENAKMLYNQRERHFNKIHNTSFFSRLFGTGSK